MCGDATGYFRVLLHEVAKPAVERGEITVILKNEIVEVIYREVVRGRGGEGEVDEGDNKRGLDCERKDDKKPSLDCERKDDKKPSSDCERENDNKPSLDYERENVSPDERKLSGGDVFSKKIESVLRTDEDHDNRLIMDEVKLSGGDEKVELVTKTNENVGVGSMSEKDKLQPNTPAAARDPQDACANKTVVIPVPECDQVYQPSERDSTCKCASWNIRRETSKPVATHPLGDARSKVQKEIRKEFVAMMTSGTIRAIEAATVATKKVGASTLSSVHFESAFGPEGSIHLGPSSSPNAPTNVVPSDATAPVTSIQEGSPPSPSLIQPIIPVIVPQIPQPGPATKSPAYPRKTSGWVITKEDQHSILGWMYVISWRRIGALQ
ncbi:hypothetical protein Tco_0706929 [Tanacetum coccineum]|uniref:Uncharacterized protein n=1 Tax=Tanacetum coccineum TaxID=301880 RepID=A0ABQ4YAX9_9ASTR